MANHAAICHINVFYKASTGKFSRVHDGSAKPYAGANSLNDCLETGHGWMENVLHMVLNFRKENFAAKSDIEKTFPRVTIQVGDRDVLRCLWLEGDQVVVYRFKKLPYGLSCSPFLLQATFRKYLGDKELDDTTLQNFISSLYCEDSVWSENRLIDLYKRRDMYSKVFAECGLDFKNWTSNHPDARAYFAKLENREEKSEELVLGLKWGVIPDTLTINANRLKEVMSQKLKTKRDLWKIVPSVYDPLGLISPFVLIGKMIVSAACKEVKSWEAKLPSKFVDLTLNWAKDFDKIENVVFNRHAGIQNPRKLELYGVSDASAHALGACVYLISTAQDGSIHSNLLISKTCNAPKIEHTIPRLELTAAVLLINLVNHVLKVYQNEKIGGYIFY